MVAMPKYKRGITLFRLVKSTAFLTLPYFCKFTSYIIWHFEFFHYHFTPRSTSLLLLMQHIDHFVAFTFPSWIIVAVLIMLRTSFCAVPLLHGTTSYKFGPTITSTGILNRATSALQEMLPSNVIFVTSLQATNNIRRSSCWQCQ
jgi:hypothetical protein